MDVKKYSRIKEQVEAIQRRADKAQGAAEQIMERLQKEVGVNTVEEGKELLKKLEKEKSNLETELEELWREFEKEYGPLETF